MAHISFKPRALLTLSAAFLALSCGDVATTNPTEQAPVPIKLAFRTQPAGALGGAAFGTQPVVEIQDANGAVVSSASLTVTVALATNGSGILSGTLTATPSGGVATFAGLKIDKAAAGYTLTVSASGLTSATSGAFDVAVGASASLTFATQPAGAAGGSPFTTQPVVKVLDAGGNLVTAATTSVTLAITTNTNQATLSGTSNKAAAAGLATFTDLVIDKAASYTLSASAQGLTGATSASLAVAVGPAARLKFATQPSGATGGIALPSFAVSVMDLGGNTVTVSTAPIALAIAQNPTGVTGALSGTPSVNAAAGVASFTNARVDKAGSGYKLAAASTGLKPDTSAVFVITVGPVARTHFVVQPGDGVAGDTLSRAPVIEVVDSGGNRVTTSTNAIVLAYANNAGHDSTGVFVSPFGAALTNGVVTFAASKINNVGAGYTLVAKRTSGPNNIGILPGGTDTSAAFNVTLGPPLQFVFKTQPGGGVAGQALSPQPVIEMRDKGGNVVPGQWTFHVRVFGSSLPNPLLGTIDGTTASNGSFTFADLAGTDAGNGVNGQSSPTTRSITIFSVGLSNDTLYRAASAPFQVTPAAPAQLYYIDAIFNPLATATFSFQPAVGFRDQYGNNVTTATSSVTLTFGTNGGGGTLSGQASVAAVAGIATFSGLSINKIGLYTFIASSAGIPSATSNQFEVRANVATRLVFTNEPTGGQGGVRLETLNPYQGGTNPSVIVEGRDAGDNPATLTSHTVTIALGANPGGTLAGAAVLQNLGASVQFDGLAIDKVGTGFTLIVASAGLVPDTTAPFNVRAGCPHTMSFTTQPGSALGGEVLTTQPVLQLLDLGGNAAAGCGQVTTRIKTNPAGGTLSGTATLTVGGVATFTDLKIDKAGSGYTLIVTHNSGTVDSIISSPFNVAVGAPFSLAFGTQPGGITLENQVLATQPVVRTLDRGGNLVTGATNSVTLTLTTNPGSASLAGTTTVAASGGVATFTNLALSRGGTGYVVTAAATSVASAVSALFDIRLAFTSLSAGAGHTCGVAAGGKAYCWGNNASGQLGTGTSGINGVDGLVPTAVVGGLAFQTIMAGGQHTCALTSGGVAYCWGDGNRVGNGSSAGGIYTSPVLVAGGRTFASLSAGPSHTCGLTSTGAMYCWGSNAAGQVGNGTTATLQAAPDSARITSVASVAVGDGFTCAARTNGDLLCWGYGLSGALADNDTTPHFVLTPTLATGGLNAVTVAAGTNHACALTSVNTIACWGKTTSGQVGDAQATGTGAHAVGSPTPTTVGILFASLTAGGESSCGLTSGNAAYCWGFAGHASSSPVRADDGHVFATLSPSGAPPGVVFPSDRTYGHTCALQADGAAYCWGVGTLGQLGTGGLTSLTAFAAVVSPH